MKNQKPDGLENLITSNYTHINNLYLFSKETHFK